MKKESTIVGLDVGTSKVCCVIGEVTEDGVDVIGVGISQSTGLKKGVVVNIDATIRAIRTAVEEAETMCGREVAEVYAGISGAHINGFNSPGMIVVRDGEIKDDDIHRVVDMAKAVSISADRDVLHIVPQDFVVDGQDGIREPIGMSGQRLETTVHIITASAAAVQNIVKCANRAGLHVRDRALQQMASAESACTADERDMGVVIVDIGAGTTDIGIFVEGTLRYTAVIGIAGNHFTTDIAVGLKAPVNEAEKIKKRYGTATPEQLDSAETFELSGMGGRGARQISRQELGQIVQARAVELAELIQTEIEKSGYAGRVPSGIVLTGGTALLEGLAEQIEKTLDLPVRRGVPQGIGGLVDVVRSPVYAASVGLMLHGARFDGEPSYGNPGDGVFHQMVSKMSDWVSKVVYAVF